MFSGDESIPFMWNQVRSGVMYFMKREWLLLCRFFFVGLRIPWHALYGVPMGMFWQPMATKLQKHNF